MYGKWRPLAILWYQLHLSGDFIFKFTRGKVCYKKGLVGRGLTVGSKKQKGISNFLFKSFRYPINDDHWKAVIIARLPRVIIVKTLGKIDGHRLFRYGSSRLFMGIFDLE